MVKTNTGNKAGSSPATTAPATTVQVVVPAAFENHDKSLKGATLQLAIQTGEKHPEIVQAVTELRAAMAVTGEKYYHVLHTLRAAKLDKKSATALLLGLGFLKSVASELNRLSSAKEEVWQQYSAKAIGFRAALALENGKPATNQTSGNETAAPSTPREVAKIHSFPRPVADALRAAVESWLLPDGTRTLPAPNKSGKRTEYGLTIEANGRTLYFQVFADAK